jgi:hypothetical protein
MNGLQRLRIAARRSLFGFADMASAEESAALAQMRLLQLKAQLGITQAQQPCWEMFSTSVLDQINRLAAARQAVTGTRFPDASLADRKRTLTFELVAAPNLLMHAARELHAALTPGQKLASGDALLKFHRQLLG